MNKTEAAEIIATDIRVWHRKNKPLEYGVMRKLNEVSRTRIAEAVSRCQHESLMGSARLEAAKLRPSDRTIIAALRKMGSL